MIRPKDLNRIVGELSKPGVLQNSDIFGVWGFPHWSRVGMYALRMFALSGVRDSTFATLFAIYHDAGRGNAGVPDDLGHAARSASLLLEHAKAGILPESFSEPDIAELVDSIRSHSAELDPTGRSWRQLACHDANVLDQYRFGLARWSLKLWTQEASMVEPLAWPISTYRGAISEEAHAWMDTYRKTSVKQAESEANRAS